MNTACEGYRRLSRRDFFVAGAGKRHVFSRTFSEHERAIVSGVPEGAPGGIAEDAEPPEEGPTSDVTAAP